MEVTIKNQKERRPTNCRQLMYNLRKSRNKRKRGLSGGVNDIKDGSKTE